MKYEEVTPLLRTYLGTFSTLRSLGFSSDDIYIETNPSMQQGGEMAAFCLLKQGANEFRIEIGPLEGRTEKDLANEYLKIAEAPLSDQDMERITYECEARQRLVHLMLALEQKGFRIPCAQDTFLGEVKKSKGDKK